MSVQKTERNDFIGICDDPRYFEIDGGFKNFIVCFKCGFIPIDNVDKNTEFVDLHCKCGNPASYTSFSEEEIVQIKEYTEYKKLYSKDLLT